MRGRIVPEFSPNDGYSLIKPLFFVNEKLYQLQNSGEVLQSVTVWRPHERWKRYPINSEFFQLRQKGIKSNYTKDIEHASVKKCLTYCKNSELLCWF